MKTMKANKIKPIKVNKAITTINLNMSVTGLGGLEVVSDQSKEVLKLSNLLIFILDFPEKTGQKKSERWDLLKKVYTCAQATPVEIHGCPQLTDAHIELTTEECELIINIADTVLINASIFGFLKDQLSN